MEKIDFKNSTNKEKINTWLHMIIEETHPLFDAVGGEVVMEHMNDGTLYSRVFVHKNGKYFLMKWKRFFEDDTPAEIFAAIQVFPEEV
jgi:hypothetical protein